MPNPHVTLVGLLGMQAASSYLLFGTLAMDEYGIVPLVTGRLVPKAGLSTADKFKIWTGYRNAGMTHTTIGVLGTAGCAALVSFTHMTPMVRGLSIWAGAFALSLIPASAVLAQPAREDLKDLDKRAWQGQLSAEDDKQVDDVLQRWTKIHMWRYIPFVGAWLASTAALVLSGNVVVDVVGVVYEK